MQNTTGYHAPSFRTPFFWGEEIQSAGARLGEICKWGCLRFLILFGSCKLGIIVSACQFQCVRVNVYLLFHTCLSCCLFLRTSPRMLLSALMAPIDLLLADFHLTYGGFLSHRGTPSSHPFLDGIFPYKPTILGYPHDCGTPPYGHITRPVANHWVRGKRANPST